MLRAGGKDAGQMHDDDSDEHESSRHARGLDEPSRIGLPEVDIPAGRERHERPSAAPDERSEDPDALERRLRERVRECDDAERTKDQFLAMLAHELRNPLAPIRNAVALLRARELDDPQARWATELIARQVEHLRRIVDDLLDVGRVTRGKIKLETRPVDLHEVVDRAVETSQPHLQRARQTLRVDVAPGPLPVLGDAARLTQVLSNVLINAAKYSEPGGSVHVTAVSDGAEHVVRVRDTGRGIAPGLLPHIFEPFVQGEQSLDRSEGGLGIGLTLAKQLIDLHDGTISARNLARGAEFEIRLPARDAPAPDRPPRPAPAVDANAPRPHRVLVVDDNVDAADALVEVLRLDGHEARAALDGEQALRVADDLHPDVLLLDIGLPGIDGRELARRFRAREDTREALIVAVSGYGNPNDVEASAAAGFDLHLVKPVHPHAIEAAMARAFRPGADRMH